MFKLGKIASTLYRTASRLNTLNILLSFNPRRIGRHIIRKRIYKAGSKYGRYRR